jgi:hypothetical protein
MSFMQTVQTPDEQPIVAFQVTETVAPGLGGGGIIPSDVARLSLPNVFQRENTFSGIRLGNIVIVTTDYNALPTDCVILVNAVGGPVSITLQPSTGNGQLYRVKKIDTSSNAVTVEAQAGDVFDGGETEIDISSFRHGVLVIDAALNYWDIVISPNVAYTDAPNVFTEVNFFSGLRVKPRTVTTSVSLFVTDFEILADATSGSLSLMLPFSLGNGQMYHIKKIDDTLNVVTITPQTGDLIDGAISVSLTTPRADAWLIAAAPTYWDNTGPSLEGVLALPVYLSKLRIEEDGSLKIWNPDQSKFHLLTVRGTAGAEYLTIGAGET